MGELLDEPDAKPGAHARGRWRRRKADLIVAVLETEAFAVAREAVDRSGRIARVAATGEAQGEDPVRAAHLVAPEWDARAAHLAEAGVLLGIPGMVALTRHVAFRSQVAQRRIVGSDAHERAHVQGLPDMRRAPLGRIPRRRTRRLSLRLGGPAQEPDQQAGQRFQGRCLHEPISSSTRASGPTGSGDPDLAAQAFTTPS